MGRASGQPKGSPGARPRPWLLLPHPSAGGPPRPVETWGREDGRPEAGGTHSGVSQLCIQPLHSREGFTPPLSDPPKPLPSSLPQFPTIQNGNNHPCLAHAMVPGVIWVFRQSAPKPKPTISSASIRALPCRKSSCGRLHRRALVP